MKYWSCHFGASFLVRSLCSTGRVLAVTGLLLAPRLDASPESQTLQITDLIEQHLLVGDMSQHSLVLWPAPHPEAYVDLVSGRKSDVSILTASTYYSRSHGGGVRSALLVEGGRVGGSGSRQVLQLRSGASSVMFAERANEPSSLALPAADVLFSRLSDYPDGAGSESLLRFLGERLWIRAGEGRSVTGALVPSSDPVGDAQVFDLTLSIDGFNAAVEIEVDQMAQQAELRFLPECGSDFRCTDPALETELEVGFRDRADPDLVASESSVIRRGADDYPVAERDRIELGLPALACRPGSLCLQGGRFEVRATWQTEGGRGQGTGRMLSDGSGFFYFFSPDNPEILVKVLDACVDPFNSQWVFTSGLTDVAVELVVTDTITRAQNVYRSHLGQPFRPILDTSAFDTCEARAAQASELASPQAGESLELYDGRFEVSASYSHGDGESIEGVGVPISSASGYFWFFDSDNVEIMVKVLDGCWGHDPRYWVFAAGLTNLEVELVIKDLETGAERTYLNPAGQVFQSITDTAAFDTCSSPAPTSTRVSKAALPSEMTLARAIAEVHRQADLPETGDGIAYLIVTPGEQGAQLVAGSHRQGIDPLTETLLSIELSCAPSSHGAGFMLTINPDASSLPADAEQNLTLSFAGREVSAFGPFQSIGSSSSDRLAEALSLLCGGMPPLSPEQKHLVSLAPFVFRPTACTDTVLETNCERADLKLIPSSDPRDTHLLITSDLGNVSALLTDRYNEGGEIYSFEVESGDWSVTPGWHSGLRLVPAALLLPVPNNGRGLPRVSVEGESGSSVFHREGYWEWFVPSEPYRSWVLPAEEVAQDTIPLVPLSTRSCGSATCHRFRMTCPAGAPAREVEIKRYPHETPSKGTVVFTTGGWGADHYGNAPETAATISDLRNFGFEIFTVKWLDGDGPGWGSGFKGRGLAGAMCGFAEILRHIARHLAANPDIVCAEGNSGGGLQIAYALSMYGMDSLLDMVFLAAGPPVADMPKLCGQSQPLTFGKESVDYLMDWEGRSRSCMRGDLSASEQARLRADSLISNEIRDMYFPTTTVHFGSFQGDPWWYLFGRSYRNELQSENFTWTLSGGAHRYDKTSQGASRIRTLMRSDCFDRRPRLPRGETLTR